MLITADMARNLVEEYSQVGVYLTQINEAIVEACRSGKRDLLHFVEAEDEGIVDNVVRALKEKGYRAKHYVDEWQWVKIGW